MHERQHFPQESINTPSLLLWRVQMLIQLHECSRCNEDLCCSLVKQGDAGGTEGWLGFVPGWGIHSWPPRGGFLGCQDPPGERRGGSQTPGGVFNLGALGECRTHMHSHLQGLRFFQPHRCPIPRASQGHFSLIQELPARPWWNWEREHQDLLTAAL